MSLFVGINFDTGRRVYVAGQVADSDVIADRYLLVEDMQATAARRKQVMLLQPSVYDLSMEPYIVFEQRLIELMRELNGVPSKQGHDAPSVQFSSDIGPELAREILPEMGLTPTQNFVLKRLLPLLRARLAEGLVGDIRTARVGRSGVIIRNLDTGDEVLRPDVSVLPDIQSFLTEISTIARGESSLSHNSRRAINIILAACLPATLSLNREATQKRASGVMDKVEPVLYQIQKGELILRRGDRVSREAQIKIQAMYHTSAVPVDWQRSLGTLLFSLFISIGFFLSPSGKPGSVIRCKDLYLISVVIFMITLSARGLYALGAVLDSSTLADAFSVAFPVAGAVGFVSMVFVARRYVTMGLQLCLFVAVTMHMDVPLMLFHFLSAMLATWLITNSISRQDAVWNLMPMILGEGMLIFAVALVNGISFHEVPMLLTAVGINALLTLILFFSLSPVLETVFGYSTRFRLMECMSLEQPLMQEIMVTIPGTYHHSLVVANMVEAGAKAIGANSLLCKVAALYHDAGKLVYPQYFIENQFGGPNKHDKLAPSMSALIIMSHVKKGIEICQSYRLGQEIVDIIAQHHGTRSIRYFYQKAINLGENPSESDYCYPGPKPQTKEAAILMLADSVEASSRTLTDPTPARLKAHIDKIIKGIFAEGQLDESELTFKDLHFLGESFQRVLTGIFHQRIAYPEATHSPQTSSLPTAVASATLPINNQEACFGRNKDKVPSTAASEDMSVRKIKADTFAGQVRRSKAGEAGLQSDDTVLGEKTGGKKTVSSIGFRGPRRPSGYPSNNDPSGRVSVCSEHLIDGDPLCMTPAGDTITHSDNGLPEIEIPERGVQKPHGRVN